MIFPTLDTADAENDRGVVARGRARTALRASFGPDDSRGFSTLYGYSEGNRPHRRRLRDPEPPPVIHQRRPRVIRNGGNAVEGEELAEVRGKSRHRFFGREFGQFQ